MFAGLFACSALAQRRQGKRHGTCRKVPKIPLSSERVTALRYFVVVHITLCAGSTSGGSATPFYGGRSNLYGSVKLPAETQKRPAPALAFLPASNSMPSIERLVVALSRTFEICAVVASL